MARLGAIPPPGARRWWRRASNLIERALIGLPFSPEGILLTILGMFQIALYWHAANSAEVAAERGVEVGKVEFDGGEAAAEAEAIDAAQEFLDATTQRNDPLVTAVIAGDVITVTVETNAPRLVGPGQWRVRSVAEGRLERFVPADER